MLFMMIHLARSQNPSEACDGLMDGDQCVFERMDGTLAMGECDGGVVRFFFFVNNFDANRSTSLTYRIHSVPQEDLESQEDLEVVHKKRTVPPIHLEQDMKVGLIA